MYHFATRRFSTAYGSEGLQLERASAAYFKTGIVGDGPSEWSVREALERAVIAVSPALSDTKYVNMVMLFADRRSMDRGTQGEPLGDRLSVVRTPQWWTFASRRKSRVAEGSLRVAYPIQPIGFSVP